MRFDIRKEMRIPNAYNLSFNEEEIINGVPIEIANRMIGRMIKATRLSEGDHKELQKFYEDWDKRKKELEKKMEEQKDE